MAPAHITGVDADKPNAAEDAPNVGLSGNTGPPLKPDLDILTHRPEAPSTHRTEEDERSEDNDVSNTVGNEESEAEDISSSRYPSRERRKVQLFDPSSAHVALSSEPQTAREAITSTKAEEWRIAINSEMQSLRAHKTWSVCSPPERVQVLPTRFVFRRKVLSNGHVGTYKVHLVVKGFMQGNIGDTYAPVVDFSTVRTAIAVAVKQGLCLKEMDVRTAFLHGAIRSDVYVYPPEGSGIDLKLGESLKQEKGLRTERSS